MPTYDSFGKGAEDAATVLAPIVFGLLLVLVLVTHRALERARTRDPSRSRWRTLLCLWPIATPLVWQLGPIAGVTVAVVLVCVGLGLVLIRLTSHREQEISPAKTADQKTSAEADEGTGA